MTTRSRLFRPTTMPIVLAACSALVQCLLASALTAQATLSPERKPASRPLADTFRMGRMVDSILALMTIEEKLGQLNQPGGPGANTGPAARAGTEQEIRAGSIGSFLGVSGAADTRTLQRVAVEESRLKIPLLFGADVIHGYRTIFPVPLGAAASWDVDAVERAARISATEATADGITWTYAPMVDIARDPRWGRIVEGAGEDPYLGSLMAAAQVRGFQGSDLAADNTLLATAKHYVAYGAASAGRDYNPADVSERTLREIYLPPFEAAVKAGAQSVMAAFNEVSGVPMHANRQLIRDVLRGEWGFDGVLVSDYTGIMELIRHGVAADSAAAGVLALHAGVDVDMVSQIYVRKLPSLVRNGTIPETLVDEAVRRVLRAKYKLGLFDDPYRYNNTERERSRTLTPAHLAEARALARKSLVLLKNMGGALPLRKDLATIAVIGPLADDAQAMLGSWSGGGRAEDAVTVLSGIRQAVSRGTRVLYAKGANYEGPDTSGFPEAVRIAREADVAILLLGERPDMSGEARSRSSLELPGVQQRLAQLVRSTGRPTVVVLMNGRPLSTQWLADSIPAIIEAWYPGVQAGPAIADVLFGDHAPSGKLPVTVPRTVGQVPIFYNHRNSGRPPSADDSYTSRYIDVPWTPLFPFGHGLSYTTFSYDRRRLSAARIRATDSIVVSVDVRNTGSRSGDEVVQLYLRDDVASVTRPVKALRGFRRITLAPGGPRTVTFTLDRHDLEFWGPGMKRIVEPGWFTVYVGTSSADVLEARFEVVK
ncbi:MAG: glycoside hydrolase family 3 N-terminal domain-containing protein [Gemmatimonadaceae bacterium]